MIYAGQETLNTSTPSLFDKEVIDWRIQDGDYYEFLKKCIRLKKDRIFQNGTYHILGHSESEVVEILYKEEGRKYLGIFYLGRTTREEEFVELQFLNQNKKENLQTSFVNQLNQMSVNVRRNQVCITDCPLIIEI